MFFKFCFICTLLASTIAQDKKVKEAAVKVFRELGQTCLEETGGTEKDLNAVVNKEPNLSHAAKCIIACVMAKSNGFKEGDEINAALIIEGLKILLLPDEKNKINIKDIVEKCAETKLQDRCEIAYTFDKCIDKNMKEIGQKVD